MSCIQSIPFPSYAAGLQVGRSQQGPQPSWRCRWWVKARHASHPTVRRWSSVTCWSRISRRHSLRHHDHGRLLALQHHRGQGSPPVTQHITYKHIGTMITEGWLLNSTNGVRGHFLLHSTLLQAHRALWLQRAGGSPAQMGSGVTSRYTAHFIQAHSHDEQQAL